MDDMKTTNKKPLSEADLARLLGQLALLTESSDARADDCLQVMAKDPSNKKYEPLLTAMLKETTLGATLSEAASHTGVFPAFALSFLSIGEQTGRLDLVLRALADYYQDADSLRQSVRDALSYPVLMTVLMAAVIVFLLAKVVPIFTEVFTQLGSGAVGLAAFASRHQQGLSVLYVVLLVLALVFAAAFFVCSGTRRGRALAQRILPRFPQIKKILEIRQTAQLASVLHMAVGVENSDMEPCLRLARGLITSPAIRGRIDRCMEDLRGGIRFSEACEKEDLFSPFCCGLLHAADESGSLDRALGLIADRYGEEADRKRTRLLSSIEPTMVIVLSVVIGVILFSVLIPLAGIMTGIG